MLMLSEVFVEGVEMHRNDVRPLNAIVKATLREARLIRTRRTANSIVLVALSGACGLPSTASAENYLVSTGAELQSAITAANANTTDPGATITLTASFAATALPASNKPITINTQSFTLTGVSLSNANSGLTFVGALAGADAAPAANAVGGIGLTTNFDASATNIGSIKGGAGGGLGGAGGAGASLNNRAQLTNNGTISGGFGTVGSGGIGVQVSTRSSVVNNQGGLIQGGDGQTGGGTGLTIGNPVGSNSLTNHGVIRGGSGLNGTPGGFGLTVRLGTLPIVNTGTIEGGNGQVAINTTGGSVNFNLTNSGVIRAGAGQAVAIQMVAGTTSLLELRAGSLIEGDVIANGASTNDTLRLGGDVDSIFDVSSIGATAQYQNFDHFEKTGASTWTLTGDGTVATPWQVQAGVLQLGDGGASGSILGDVVNNGVLAFNRSNALTHAGAISGSGAVEQVGAGTTVLTAINSYTGGTSISGGVLQVSSDGNLGNAAGALRFNGGALQTTADMSSARAVSLVGNGGFITDAGTTLTLGGLVSGAGSLTKSGNGTLVLTADNSYTGGTAINGGVLQVSSDAKLGDAAGALSFSGGSLQTSADISTARAVDLLGTGGFVTNAGTTLTLNGAITGAGSLVKDGNGTLILARDNSYAGGTTISAGALQIGAGATSGSIVGDVLNNGTLIINRSDALTLGGTISGTGSVNQVGTGTTILTADNTNSGGAVVSAGTLQLGHGGTSGSLTGNVTNNGTLAFNRSDALAFSGVIAGNGVLIQSGTGTTTLSAAGSNATTLDIQRGVLELANGAGLAVTATSVATGASLRNSGVFTGTAGGDTFKLAGTFIGSAELLDGDDLVQIADGANGSQAAFDGGTGVDTLEFTNSTASTLPPTLATNFEHLVKGGSGVLTLSGNVAQFSDSITIAAGSAQLANANVLTNQMSIASGAAVTGMGTLSGSLGNAGTLSPGNSPGTIHVGGQFTQASTGTLISEVLPTGTDLLDVAGSAALAGTHQIRVGYGLYLDGTTHTLLRAGGGITGAFDSVEINPSALMTTNYQSTGNAETVSFARQPFVSITDPQTGRGRFATWLEQQVDDGMLTPQMTDYIDSLLQQPTAHGAEALLGNRGEPIASVTQNSVSILGAGFARTVFERFTLNDGAQCAPTQHGSNDTLNCFWSHGLRQWGDVGGDSRYDWTTSGGQIGIDRDLSSEWKAGATFGYADTDTSDLFAGHSEVRSKMGGLYASYAPGPLTVSALAFYSANDNDTRRTVAVGSASQQARAKFDSDSYGAGIRIGYRVTDVAEPLVRSFIDAFYDHVEGTQFSETDAGAGNLSAQVSGRDGLRGTLGVQLADDFEGYGHVFHPALELGVAHQFGDVRSTLELRPFSDASAFRTSGPALDRTAYVARASLNVSLGENGSVALGYGGEIAKDYSQHEVNLSFRISW
jgi:autotransporter-associated beta strand protein